MELKIIMLNEVSQAQRAQYSYTYLKMMMMTTMIGHECKRGHCLDYLGRDQQERWWKKKGY
jgi:hypothetical protein